MFSRFAQCIPLKRKDANSLHNDLNKILNSGHFNNLKRLNADEDREFYNEKVKKMLTSKDITLYSVSSREIKAAIAERFIRTLKGKLFRYMTHQNTKKYIHILLDIIKSYNLTLQSIVYLVSNHLRLLCQGLSLVQLLLTVCHSSYSWPEHFYYQYEALYIYQL